MCFVFYKSTILTVTKKEIKVQYIDSSVIYHFFKLGFNLFRRELFAQWRLP